MVQSPLRLLAAAYGLSLALAIVGGVAGLPLWAAALVFWIGAAVAVPVLSAIPALARPLAIRPPGEVEDIAAWDADRSEERAEALMEIAAGERAEPRLRKADRPGRGTRRRA